MLVLRMTRYSVIDSAQGEECLSADSRTGMGTQAMLFISHTSHPGEVQQFCEMGDRNVEPSCSADAETTLAGSITPF